VGRGDKSQWTSARIKMFIEICCDKVLKGNSLTGKLEVLARRDGQIWSKGFLF
jgi:hypothetical protein